MSYPPPPGGYPDPYQQPPQSGPPAGYGQQPPPGYGPPPGGPPPGYGPPPGGMPPGGPPPGGMPPGGPPPGGGYPPPGQPGQPPGFLPPQQPKKSKTGLILGLSLGGGGFLVLVIVVVVLLFSGGGASSPKAAVESYFNAAESGDISTAEDLSCEADLAAAEEAGQGDINPEDLAGDSSEYEASYEVGEEQVDGDRATVDVSIESTYMGETTENTLSVTVVDEDGWKVCMSETDFGF